MKNKHLKRFEQYCSSAKHLKNELLARKDK